MSDPTQAPAEDRRAHEMKLTRIGNLVAALAHPKDDHCQNELEDEAHDLLRELGAELTRLSRELDTERSRFAFYAERAEELYVELDRRAASDWGHLRYQVVGFLADAVKQFRAYAAGQPSPSNWRKRAEAAEAELSRLSRVEQALRTECTCRMIEKCERCEAIDGLSVSPEAQAEEPCANGHIWSNQYGDDWSPDTGTLCDCRKKQWGVPEAQPEEGR